MRHLTAFLVLAMSSISPLPAAEWLYVLRLVPRLHDDTAWTPADAAAVGRHFQRLQQATQDGVVILAGRTQEPGDRTQGLVIFRAPDEAAARAFMDADPTIVDGVMTATLHPYAVALLGSAAHPAPSTQVR